ncbi:hypothetical protein OS122_02750 [Mycolicibacterium mucogenicum]|uniref:hypothetical protein n=1 Tax=Mycolicibacterium mucogenicum TaxID=56689 RepID=UPI00226A2EEF|nr:hypothetical protein [Mycolicibacterium mucogenicum]MCX8559818.1 hypothetical protein [Mycolicibacterium mucogenicum]
MTQLIVLLFVALLVLLAVSLLLWGSNRDLHAALREQIRARKAGEPLPDAELVRRQL